MNLSKDQIIQVIKEYTGKEPTKVKTYKDPKVDGCVAFRASFKGEEDMDGLITGQYVDEFDAQELADEQLEDCEFESWPPKPGPPIIGFL